MATTAQTAKPRVRVQAGRAVSAPSSWVHSPITGATAAAPGQHFEAAGNGHRWEGLQPTSAGPATATVGAAPAIIARSRRLAANNEHADRILSQWVTHAIGTGIRPQIQNAELSRLWNRWVRQVAFYRQQSLAFREMLEGGDGLARLRTRRPEDGLAVPLDLQLIESEQLPHAKSEPVNNRRNVVGGIEVDPIGRVAAYHFLRAHPDESYSALTGAGVDITDTSRVPASDVCHMMIPRRAGQMRGEPLLTRAMQKIFELDRYLDAEAVRKRAAALIAAWIKKPRPDEDAAHAGGGPTDEGDDPNSLLSDWMPGTMNVLPDGWEVQFSEPADVGQNFEAYVRIQQRAIAVAGGILYEHLTGDDSQTNDRKLRASLLNFRREVQRLQEQVVVQQFCQPIWERFVDLAVLSGAFELPEGTTNESFYDVRWVPQSFEHIHPVQEVDATTKAIEAGLKDRDSAVIENGRDPEEVDRRQAAANRRAQQLDLFHSPSPHRHDSGAVYGDDDDTESSDG